LQILKKKELAKNQLEVTDSIAVQTCINKIILFFGNSHSRLWMIQEIGLCCLTLTKEVTVLGLAFIK